MMEWLSANTPPKESRWVLVCFDDITAIPEVAHYNALSGYEGFYSGYTETLLPNVIYWMDLPELPFG